MNRLLVFVFSGVLATSAAASNRFEANQILLYQPDEVLKQRLPDAAKLADYIVRLQSACKSFLGRNKTPERLDIVVAVRPGKHSRVWLVSSTRPANDPRQQALRKKLEGVTPCEVNRGPVAFAIVARIAGGDGRTREGLPMPKEWQDAAGNDNLIMPDGILDLVWPNTFPPVEVKAPTGFITQILEPTGGKIVRPKNWFYNESHRGPSYNWTLSLEDSSKGKYTTGVNIQMVAGVKENTGNSPREFVLNYVSSKKKEAKVLKACDETEQGMFTRICLETEEGPHHILYSLFWNDKMDMVVFVIAGTTKGLWDVYSDTFDKMTALELIDLKRFEK